jgi:hypothetical protein
MGAGEACVAWNSKPFCGNGPHPLLWAVSRTELRKIIVNGIPNGVNCCDFFLIVYTHFTNVVAGSISQPGGPRVGCIDAAGNFYLLSAGINLCFYVTVPR